MVFDKIFHWILNYPEGPKDTKIQHVISDKSFKRKKS